MINSVQYCLKTPIFKGDNTVNFALSKADAPELAVVDGFTYKTIDAIGNGRKNCTHGDFCAAVAKSIFPEVKIVKFKLRYLSGRKDAEDLDSVVNQFNKIYKQIENGEKIEAVNFSCGQPKTFYELSEYIGKQVTKDNIHEYKEDILEWLKKLGELRDGPDKEKVLRQIDPDKYGLEKLHTAIKAIEKVAKRVPVFIAAGSEGPNTFNLYSLAEGTIPVAALESDDKNAKKLYTSCDNSMIKDARRGIYFTAPVLDEKGDVIGYSLMDDNHIVFKKDDIKGGKPIVERFIGRRARDVLASEENYFSIFCYIRRGETKIINRAENKLDKVLYNLYKISDIINSDRANFLKKQGILVDRSLKHVFTINNNEIVYEPVKSSRKLVTWNGGSSFAAPNAAAEYLKKKYAQQNSLSFSGQKLSLIA